MLPCPGDPDWSVVLRLDEAETHLDRMRHYQPDLLVEYRGADEANTYCCAPGQAPFHSAHLGLS